MDDGWLTHPPSCVGIVLKYSSNLIRPPARSIRSRQTAEHTPCGHNRTENRFSTPGTISCMSLMSELKLLSPSVNHRPCESRASSNRLGRRETMTSLRTASSSSSCCLPPLKEKLICDCLDLKSMSC